MKYSITWYENFSIVEFSGSINQQDVENANASLHGDNRLYKTSASIWDLSKCSMKNIKHDDLKYTTVTDLGSNKTIKSFKLAMIANEPHSINLIEKYISDSLNFGSPWEFKIFNTSDDAHEWINA